MSEKAGESLQKIVEICTANEVKCPKDYSDFNIKEKDVKIWSS